MTSFDVTGSETHSLVFHNSLGWTRRQITTILINSPNIQVYDSDGQNIDFQVTLLLYYFCFIFYFYFFLFIILLYKIIFFNIFILLFSNFFDLFIMFFSLLNFLLFLSFIYWLRLI